MRIDSFFAVGICLFLMVAESEAEITVMAGLNEFGLGFTFQSVPSPSSNDAATDAQFRLVDGLRDTNGGDLAVLHDGRVPTHEDQPSENFFFAAGTAGGRIQLDLGKTISVKQICSYSWHAGSRASQVYQLYASNGTADTFQALPKSGTDPSTCGWSFIAKVDTRPKVADGGGGQHGVSIVDSDGLIGKYRFLLFDISRTENRDPFGNTFLSEIDVIDADGPAPTSTVQKRMLQTFDSDNAQFHFIMDITEAADLAEWAGKDLKGVILEWYPKIVKMLPSEGYRAPATVLFRFRGDMGATPASASGASVNLNLRWFRRERNHEACGAVVHELVHIVQNYWQAQRDRKGAPTPGWLVEGIADYIRWFLYEPQSKGAEISKANLAGARYDSSYRVTGNFLDWVTQKYDKEIVRKLNAAAREGNYTEQLWQDYTNKTVQELGREWKQFHDERLRDDGNR